ncbi:uncharacterized protein LOC132973475 [Labrus mixtus]|uniref:uncharacterized protein LOC132973475 n=1 Tax=Labrus mixtus TaxID=508554 RepID=UPI0029BFA972|nr:uncharacterized protein LOC132973475 [Labrus mixtus]
MLLQVQFILLSLLLIFESPSMHGLPCSSLGHCFGNSSDVNPDPAPPREESNNSRQSRNNHRLPDPIISQPEALPSRPREEQHKHTQRTISCISTHSTITSKVNGSHSISVCSMQDADDHPCFESPPPCHSLSQSSEDEELEFDCSPELEMKYPQIPRPSIIIRQSKEPKFQETESDRSDSRETEDGGLSGMENKLELPPLFSPLPSPPPAPPRWKFFGHRFENGKDLRLCQGIIKETIL